MTTPPREQPAAPLSGVRVLDLSRFIAGPLCAQILADFGAEVIKVERPDGEDARHHFPYLNGESLYPMLYNRNKHGITLDTRHAAALPILDKLVGWADIVVENYRPGTLEKMGIGYRRMSELNPGVIVVSISGFGQTGPDSSRALFDAIAQASSGLMSITGEPDGQPTLSGTYIADYVTGMQAAIGALGALTHRRNTGEGQVVDVASFDSTFAILGIRLIAHLMLGLDMPRSGSRDLLTAPANVYECRDGSMYIQAGTDSLFQRLCPAIDRPDLLAVAEYSTVEGRMAEQDTLEECVAQWARTRTSGEIASVLDAAGIPNAKVATIAEVAASPQIEARQMIEQVQHPTIGTLQLPASPIKMERTPIRTRKAPPTCGEDNDSVYARILGISPTEIDQLRTSGAI